MSDDGVFKNREAVERELNLPGLVSYSFIGDAAPEYHAKLVATIESVVEPDKIRRRSARPSRSGNYVAYRFEIFHEVFEHVEAIYARVGKLDGTRFVL